MFEKIVDTVKETGGFGKFSEGKGFDNTFKDNGGFGKFSEQKQFGEAYKQDDNFGKDIADAFKKDVELRHDETEKQELIKNKEDGCRREKEVGEEIEKEYPEEEGYTIEKEVYLRDKDGNIVRDPVTGEARRIDYVVIKDEKVVASIEVTSNTADKTEQSAKEARIRESGGNYIKDSNGNLIEIPSDVTTTIERRD